MKKRLEEIRRTAVTEHYGDALAELDALIKSKSGRIEPMRLKGNTLELRALVRAEHSPRKLLRSRDFLEARKCYEAILAIEPANTLALIDLGDHFRQLGANSKALGYYESAMLLLSKGRFSWSRRHEVEEAFGEAAELYEELGRDADKARVEQARRRIVARMRARHTSRGRAGPVRRRRQS